MKAFYSFLFLFLLSCHSDHGHNSFTRDPASLKNICSKHLSKVLGLRQTIKDSLTYDETPFDDSRRKFMSSAAATVATAAIGPGQLLKMASSGAKAVLPARAAILRKAANLRNGITINGTETYKEALVRAAENADFSEIGDVLMRRAGQIQERLGSDEVIKALPKRILQEGTQQSRSSVLDMRIQRSLTKARRDSLKAATQKLTDLREEILLYLEDSMIHQVLLFKEGDVDLSSFLHLFDKEVVSSYHKMLLNFKEKGIPHSELFPNFEKTVDEYLEEMNSL